MTQVRKKWTAPQLVVLARGTPEEAVLAGCKYAGVAKLGPNVNCTKANGTAQCDVLVAS